MPRLSRSPLTVVAIAALVGSVLLGGGTAWAAWAVSGTGAGGTAAGSLVTPEVTATRSTSSPTTAIDVSWTAAGQPPGATYSVTRNGTTISCANPCTDSGLAPGTSYNYVVTPKIGTNWSAASASATASTSGALLSTTTTVQSSQNPAKSGVAVTLTATVTAASGTPTGSVIFKDGSNTIVCADASPRTLSSGSASCQTTFSTTGLHPVTAEYSGASGFAASTSTQLSQRIVNGNVTALAFANVTVNGSSVTLNSGNCNGLGTANVACTISGANGASLAADVQFVNATNSVTAYSAESVQGSSAIETKNGTVNGTVTFATTGSASPRLTGSKSGNDHVYITVSYVDGANTFTATLKMN